MTIGSDLLTGWPTTVTGWKVRFNLNLDDHYRIAVT